ncbi:MAG: Protein translocase subunit SecF [Candidatus Yanofskybacteria bacterium GW2011_GWD2_39_48]|uniref:Protein-export membrane protein SecF n=1 Tax=Candidatus Yanofskybacteria bacterium GW2011_GWD2_39_48 TaxID=1619031 RepID=A0A0G0P3B5_9BACT|nr:MAG: Protein translocase subunit SecF [Candidatus Yanofskybacteria bacterium GW2011_GWD2_39_48]
MKAIYKIVFIFSVVITIVAIVCVFSYGLKLGVDFRGGSIIELEFANARPQIGEIQKELDGLQLKELSINFAGTSGVIIKTSELSEAAHQQILINLKTKFGETNIDEKRFDSIGPTIGQELKSRSILAIIIVLIAVIIYIALVFRKLSRTLSPWAMGISAVAALIHDVAIPMGVFAILGRFYNVEMGAIFLAAALTILGYSVSDTVVVFDRVRENIVRGKAKEDFGLTVHHSIMQTLSRSLNTTFTTLFALIAIYLFGGESVKYFALALIIGIFLGAYSSIFIASPILVWWTNRRRRP